MKKKLTTFACLLLCMAVISCSSKKDSASSVAQEWCELNGKVYKASEGAEKTAAETARKKFEDDMENKYKNDEAFMKKIGEEIEKCEDASEGRK